MSRTLSALLLATALGAAACTDAPATDAGLAAGDRDLVTLATKTGAVRFIADDSGGVGVLERGAVAVGPAERLLERDQATPLEVFLALAPADAAVPVELTANHAALRGDAAPRALAAPLAETVESNFASCTTGAWTPWHNAATASYDARTSLYITTSADIWRSFYINDQYKRRFDACTPTYLGNSGLTLQMLRKTNAGAWQNAAGWEKIDQNEHFFFVSIGGSYPDWQMRVTRPSSGITVSYGAAGAWSDQTIVIGGGG